MSTLIKINYCDWLPVGVSKQWVLHSHHCESISTSTINVYVVNGLILRNNNMYALTNLVTEIGPVYTKYQHQYWDNFALTVVILFSLETMELLQNGIATNFQAIPLFSMRTELLVSSKSCRNDADAWCKRALNLFLGRHLHFIIQKSWYHAIRMSTTDVILADRFLSAAKDL